MTRRGTNVGGSSAAVRLKAFLIDEATYVQTAQLVVKMYPLDGIEIPCVITKTLPVKKLADVCQECGVNTPVAVTDNPAIRDPTKGDLLVFAKDGHVLSPTSPVGDHLDSNGDGVTHLVCDLQSDLCPMPHIVIGCTDEDDMKQRCIVVRTRAAEDDETTYRAQRHVIESMAAAYNVRCIEATPGLAVRQYTYSVDDMHMPCESDIRRFRVTPTMRLVDVDGGADGGSAQTSPADANDAWNVGIDKFREEVYDYCKTILLYMGMFTKLREATLGVVVRACGGDFDAPENRWILKLFEGMDRAHSERFINPVGMANMMAKQQLPSLMVENDDARFHNVVDQFVACSELFMWLGVDPLAVAHELSDVLTFTWYHWYTVHALMAVHVYAICNGVERIGSRLLPFERCDEGLRLRRADASGVRRLFWDFDDAPNEGLVCFAGRLLPLKQLPALLAGDGMKLFNATLRKMMDPMPCLKRVASCIDALFFALPPRARASGAKPFPSSCFSHTWSNLSEHNCVVPKKRRYLF